MARRIKIERCIPVTTSDDTKSAFELYLTENQKAVLTELLVRLKTGQIKELPPSQRVNGPDVYMLKGLSPQSYNGPLDYFFYGYVGAQWDCGTSGDIQGWCKILE